MKHTHELVAEYDNCFQLLYKLAGTLIPRPIMSWRGDRLYVGSIHSLEYEKPFWVIRDAETTVSEVDNWEEACKHLFIAYCVWKMEEHIGN